MFPITTVTRLNEEELTKANMLAIKRRQRLTLPITIILFVIYLGIMAYSHIKGAPVTPVEIVCIIVLIFYILYFALILPLVVKRNVKKVIEKGGERTMTAVFEEDKFSVSVEGEKMNGSESILYSVITEVSETEGYFYPQFSRSMLIVSKQGLSEEQTAALRQALCRYLPAGKYRRVNN